MQDDKTNGQEAEPTAAPETQQAPTATGEHPTAQPAPGPNLDNAAASAGEADPDTAPAAPAGGAPPVAEDPTTDAFAELLEQSGAQPAGKWRKGDKVQGTVVRVTDDWVFVSLGGKQEGTVAATEFSAAPATPAAEAPAEEDAAVLPAVGDDLEAYVLSTRGGEVVLTTRLSRREASVAALQDAWEGGIPVEGKVVQSVKGGFEVRVAGVRAFCPLSQVDFRWPKDPSQHIGKTYTFRILEFKEGGRNIIVSRRQLLEEERRKQREELQSSVVPGAVVSGIVRSLQDFGAFVDLGGVDALIPISELGWGRVESPGDVLAEGQEVRAQVLSVDWDRDRVSLSLKALQGDPWAEVAGRYAPGQRVKGTVARLAKFGAFVSLESGVDGLVHVSALGTGKRVGHPKEVLEAGQEVEVEVLSVDPAKRRISLSMDYQYWESLGDLPRAGQVLEGSVEKVVDFGLFVKLPSGHTGLVPNVEVGTPRGTDHSKMFRPGDGIEVTVLGVEDGGKRIRLSRKAVGERRDAQITAEYAAQGDAEASLGTLGDLLKEKLGRR